MTYNEFKKQAGIGTVVAPGLVTYGGLYFGLEKVPTLKKRRLMRALIAAAGGLGVSGSVYGISKWLGSNKQKQEAATDSGVAKEPHFIVGYAPNGRVITDNEVPKLVPGGPEVLLAVKQRLAKTQQDKDRYGYQLKTLLENRYGYKLDDHTSPINTLETQRLADRYINNMNYKAIDIGK